ncbi:unnamed protein product [Rangifer tarandus platyrhynchus]|uniref:Uncharacterized protein n=2 Tax=Rangifer tarandus platyrhynchus TaxID=3082113 RepID=A0AC59ZM29_RANTA|nr:unnamed protein product [Rangifer tarandus platyrhynchus]
MCLWEDTHSPSTHALSHVHTPVSMGRTMDCSPGRPLGLHWNQHEDLCTHLATQRPVPSRVDACAPRPQPPLLCCLPRALAWPGEGSWEGGRAAKLLPPVLRRILLTL